MNCVLVFMDVYIDFCVICGGLVERFMWRWSCEYVNSVIMWVWVCVRLENDVCVEKISSAVEMSVNEISLISKIVFGKMKIMITLNELQFNMIFF